MLSKSVSFGIHGIDARIIEVEVDIVRGLPNFIIVGLPDSTIRESRERIRSAVENSGYEFPPKNFVVNLAPAGCRKQGSTFDLPIAVSILHATGQTDADPAAMPMVGELSLDGSVKPVRGVISMAIAMYRNGYRSIIVPFENRREAAAVGEITVFPVRNIGDSLDALRGRGEAFSGDYTEQGLPPAFDFADVRGQETAKRAIEIAAAGRHNILLYGSPGSGKTMLARRIPTILPPLSMEQAIETTMIHSVGGELRSGSGLISRPPFRAPHHTASDAALVGGGVVPSVGEVSLAHHGVLFLDEFVEFRGNVIQALRQPLEDCEITIARAMGTCRFPADFMLVAASNPCRCGHLFDPEIPCSCAPHHVRSYFSKIAGPVMDRIDIEVPVNRVPCRDLLDRSGFTGSSEMRERVMTARDMQAKRLAGSGTRYNARMTQDEIKRYCRLTPDAESALEAAARKTPLTARSFFKIIKVGRSIADLAGSGDIDRAHLLEALSYKNLHRVYET